MSNFAELLGNNVDRWREHVESQVTKDQTAFAERLDEAQASVNGQHWYVANGHEVEFRLVSPHGLLPDRNEFYDAFVARICGGVQPPDVEKGAMLDPRDATAPIFVTKEWDASYLWEFQGAAIMEVGTTPSTDWREGYERYWKVLGTLGEMAVTYGCRAQILGTHMSTSTAWLNSKGALITEDNYRGNGKMLRAMQQARMALEPLEPYASLVQGRGETYSSKEALWALHRHRVETRFPVFGVVDSRLSMLGALAGVDRLLHREPALEHVSLHSCQKPQLISPHPELEALSGMMLWDVTDGEMVLPETVTRGGIAAATTSGVISRLDRLVGLLSGGRETDFSANNASFLRAAVGELVLQVQDGFRGSLTIDATSPYLTYWKPLLAGVALYVEDAARIVPKDAPEESMGFVADRQRATASPGVVAILGEQLLAALTPARKAYALRQLTLNTRGTVQ